MNKKISFDELISNAKKIIIKKNDGLNHQDLDDEILGYISIYEHGAPRYKEYAKEFLTHFFINAGFIKNKRMINFE